MTSHTLNNHELLVGELPEGATNLSIHPGFMHTLLMYEIGGGDVDGIRLPPLEWSLLCTRDTASEEVAAGLVEKNESQRFKAYSPKGAYVPGGFTSLGYKTALESLQSFLRSIGKDPNSNWYLLEKIEA